jgi:hypothetical protein
MNDVMIAHGIRGLTSHDSLCLSETDFTPQNVRVTHLAAI